MRNASTSTGTSGLVLGILFLVMGGIGAALPTWAGSSPMTAAPPNIASDLFRWRPFLAPFHSVVLHYPIGFLTLAFILELYALRRPSPELRRITTLVIILSLGSGVIAAALGLMRASSESYDSQILAVHRSLGIAIPILTLLTWCLHARSGRPLAARGWLTGYRVALSLTLVVLVMGGHNGGNLTHGSRYLVQYAPQFVRSLLDDNETPPNLETPLDASQKYFVEKIQPILQSKCIPCHGPEKQKGKYRLDLPDLALKGGTSGLTAIKPKDPFASDLVRRILLPRNHDDAMPPDGKDPLKPDEIIEVVHWIQDGAGFASPTVTVPSSTNAPASQ